MVYRISLGICHAPATPGEHQGQSEQPALTAACTTGTQGSRGDTVLTWPCTVNSYGVVGNDKNLLC